ncbi:MULTISPECIES: hypothetical protein [unclassified Streptomyces]|uniref:hypothetical protein n=1 Tax=unclassified Streptomyces TaxID=2593676 RepID=UPI002DDB3212|nr:hypothetical protein [Streptomyces sp. NBC_01750]WSA98487.1 hypothetical protein OIE54_03995 [Streptomyces sp. NBC_01794]WSD36977.1 hypothetical protein OG966_36795 [Streptomyces sp. NBC_01750]
MTTGRGVRRAGAATVVALLCCGLLVACGHERPGAGEVVAGGGSQGQSGTAEGSTDETTDESGAEHPDLTTEGDGDPVVTSEEEMAGWYDAKADFRGYLSSNAVKSDDVLPPMVGKVIIRKVGDRNEARIWMREGFRSDEEHMRRVADAFATWRQDVYDDTGRVSVLAGAKMGGTEKDW